MMTSQYDLAIVGATAAGRAAALGAAARGVRVALLEQGVGLAQAKLYTTALCAHAQQQPGSGIGGLQAAIAKANWAIAALSEQQSAWVLGDRGVDYIAEFGQFSSGPTLDLATATRQLHATRYLLTPGWRSRLPQLAGLNEAGYLTPEQIWADPQCLLTARRLAILGATALAVELAQSLQRLGWSVTLLAPQQLLPTLDRTVAYWLQAQLEADGVEVLTHSAVTQVRTLDGQKWLQAGDQAIAVDEIMLACGLQPELSDWQLGERLAITANGQLQVNARLQTAHPHIFACRRSDAAIAVAEAAIAVANALGQPRQTMSYHALPIAIATDPPLAAVGWTETWARQQLAAEALITTVQAAQASRAQLLDATTGGCKLIARRDGEILGAHAFGLAAAEWIGAIAFAIQQGLPVADLAAMPVTQPSASELIPLVARAALKQCQQ
ncbi:MAG: NAD(P)/FAD-dependent oxidoreductase [Spirulinaceae cyanobacterium SM2_1_0]|nr:NAD(P)/FAD-dependent oxidoreductase [Spirulinaceae cyanobacterium SM2_1_0]